MYRPDDRRQKQRERLQKQLLGREVQSNASPDDRIQKCEQDLSFLMEGLTIYFGVSVPANVFLYPVAEDGPARKSPSAKDAIIEWSTIIQFLNREWTKFERHFLASEGQGQTKEREIVPGNVPVRNFFAEGREKWKRLNYLAKDLPDDAVIGNPARLHVSPVPQRKGNDDVKLSGKVRAKETRK